MSYSQTLQNNVYGHAMKKSIINSYLPRESLYYEKVFNIISTSIKQL